jgi:hypothetical protein
MKKIIKISMLTLVLGLMSFSAVTPIQKIVLKSTSFTSVIVWKSELIDLGEIPQNIPKSIEFEFKNTGKTAVVITNVKAACGCTATDYTKTPVKPGATAKVVATYNAAAIGAFSKTVTVTTNADENPKVLTFKGVVKAKS